MFKHLFLIVIFVSVSMWIYGIYNLSLEVEDNACQMTYMFKPPQYSKINFRDNMSSPFYGLYYYNEGMLPVDITKIKLNGAPVIFVPGNGGSYKQVRSLASVALKKGTAKGTHLDYYTIDFNEELSAMFGNYLERQTRYLKTCIDVVLSLYSNNSIVERQVVLIGHSMGAVIAHAVLRDLVVSKYINTIIALSSPINKPVVNLDIKIDTFYTEINNYLVNNRSFFEPKFKMNFCSTSLSRHIPKNISHNIDPISSNILLISIGGGNRDLLVPAGLTISRFSEIHSTTVSIPYVWVSCDHLSSVWCLQLVLVINRYIFNISTKDSQNYAYFIKNKNTREQLAYHHFVKPEILMQKEKYLEQKVKNNTIWHEDSRKFISKTLKEVKNNFIQLIPVWKYSRNQKLYIEAFKFDQDDVLFGCAVKSSLNESMYCKEGATLSHNFQMLPSPGTKERSFAILDIYNLKKTYENWTHIGLHINAAQKSKTYNIDIYNATERHMHLITTRWYRFQKTSLIKESGHGSLYYKLLISGLEETYTTMELIIDPVACAASLNPITIKMCIPWAPGLTKYKIFRPLPFESFYINIPVVIPTGYNKSNYPISLDIFLDSSCRYHISYKFSYAATMSRIVQQYYQWLPSHLTAIVLIVLKKQLWKLHSCSNGKDVIPYLEYFQYSSFYVIMGCRILSKLLTTAGFISPSHGMSLHLIVIIHSTAIVLSIFSVLFLWSLVSVSAYGLSIIANWCPSRTVIRPIENSLPILFGIFINALAIKTCGGLALIVTCIFYFLLISNGYKDYIENWTFRTAVALYKRVQHLHVEQNPAITSQNKSLIGCEGTKNFSFHISVFILAFIMASLNVMPVVAWMKDSSILTFENDPSLFPSISVTTSLCVLWSLKAPMKASSFGVGFKGFISLLYLCACGAIIYCQTALHRLNFIISFVFLLLLVQEILCHVCSHTYLKTKKNK